MQGDISKYKCQQPWWRTASHIQQMRSILCLKEDLRRNMFCLWALLKIEEWKPGAYFLSSLVYMIWVTIPWLGNKEEDAKQMLPLPSPFPTWNLQRHSERRKSPHLVCEWIKGRYLVLTPNSSSGLLFKAGLLCGMPGAQGATWEQHPNPLAYLTLPPPESQLLSLSQGSLPSPTSLGLIPLSWISFRSTPTPIPYQSVITFISYDLVVYVGHPLRLGIFPVYSPCLSYCAQLVSDTK